MNRQLFDLYRTSERFVVYRYGNTIENPTYENHWVTIFADEVEGARLKKIIGKEVVASL